MMTMRLAQDGDIGQQKELWKICFGDDDTYIDFYFDHQYKKENAAVLLRDQVIVAMATMIPGRMILANGEALELAMLYAIATHPSCQGQGFSTQIMDFCHDHLKGQNKDLSILVPAQESLFDFYAKRGYQKGFHIREVTLSQEQIAHFEKKGEGKSVIRPITASDYNTRRQMLLQGQPYVDYNHQEIDYQKKLCQKYGGDLYGLDIEDVKGCLVAEKISKDKLLIKEILLPDQLIQEGLRKVMEALPAKIYEVRSPGFLGQALGGTIRPFGMFREYGENNRLSPDKLTYLGIAYD